MFNDLEVVIDGNEIFDFATYALEYKNACDFEFRNCEFLKEDILKIIEFKEYNRIAFVTCSFENINLLKNIRTKSISFTNNKISSYDFVYEIPNLKGLTIVGGKADALGINLIENLEYLRLSYSELFNIESLNTKKINYLFLDNTNVKDISFVKRFNDLTLLSISKEQESYNKEFISTLPDRVKIVLDGMIETDVSSDD